MVLEVKELQFLTKGTGRSLLVTAGYKRVDKFECHAHGATLLSLSMDFVVCVYLDAHLLHVCVANFDSFYVHFTKEKIHAMKSSIHSMNALAQKYSVNIPTLVLFSIYTLKSYFHMTY